MVYQIVAMGSFTCLFIVSFLAYVIHLQKKNLATLLLIFFYEEVTYIDITISQWTFYTNAFAFFITEMALFAHLLHIYC